MFTGYQILGNIYKFIIILSIEIHIPKIKFNDK